MKHLKFNMLFISLLCLWLPLEANPQSIPHFRLIQQMELEMLELVNKVRREKGIDTPLILNDDLRLFSRSYSRIMHDKGFFNHVDDKGQTLITRLSNAGINYTKAGEALAYIADADDPVMTAYRSLMNSPAHRQALLDPEYRLIGIGVERSPAGDEFWFTQTLLAP